MNEASITIPFSALKSFDPTTRLAILAYVAKQLDIQPAESGAVTVSEGRDEKGLAKLDVPEAKFFLNKCSQKTTLILREIVNGNGDFTMSAIAALVGTTMGQLRGAWSGLTKRVRTVTGDPEAMLINWFREGDDWRGVMAARTVSSMRVALEERH